MDQNKELKKAGLKVTLPRLKILEILQQPNNQHISAEDVYKILLEQDEDIGLATVYRVVEFEDPVIERRQLEVAEQNNMKLTHHSLYMYGECNDENCDADS